MQERNCETCGALIPEERLEYLPNTRHCVECAAKLPVTQRTIDIAQSSNSARNGFAPKDS